MGQSKGDKRVKSPLAVRETWVRSLGREDPLEKEMATHSSTLAGRIPWTEEQDSLQSMETQRVGHNCGTNFNFHFSRGIKKQGMLQF